RLPGEELCRIEIGTKANVVAFAPDGKSIAVACADGSVSIRAAATGRPEVKLQTAGKAARVVALSPDGRSIVTVAEADRPSSHPRRKLTRLGGQMGDAADGTELALADELSQPAHTVVFHPIGRKLAAIHLCSAAGRTLDPFTDYKFGVRHSIEDRTE